MTLYNGYERRSIIRYYSIRTRCINSQCFQQDSESGGFGSRGDYNIIPYNEIYENQGAGIRLGGHVVDNIYYGIGNDVYGNIIYDNAARNWVKMWLTSDNLVHFFR